MHLFRLHPFPPRLRPPDDPLWARLDERPVTARMTVAWIRADRAHRLTRVTGSRLAELPTDLEHIGDRVEIRIAGTVVESILVADLLGRVE